MGLSALAYNFLGGVINSADALCAIFNPTVNSYKRINAPRTISGATWAPNMVSYGGNNRTHMVRIPEAGRFELRLMDGGKRLDINMYTEGHKARGLKKLPLNLLDAVRTFEKSKVLRQGLGDALVSSYAKLKLDEWDSFKRQITPWERAHTLDC
jgi:glutamine synthetase